MDQYIARMRNEHAFDDTASVTLVAGKFYVRMGQFQQRCEFASEFLSQSCPVPSCAYLNNQGSAVHAKSTGQTRLDQFVLAGARSSKGQGPSCLDEPPESGLFLTGEGLYCR